MYYNKRQNNLTYFQKIKSGPVIAACRENYPDNIESIDTAYEKFIYSYPEYFSTGKLDQLRSTEYARLDGEGQIYLDYTGGGLYAECQLREHLAMLGEKVFGNPHSKNIPSTVMTQYIDQTRDTVLNFFNASPEEYMVIFTQNTTNAIKLVGESYPFGAGDTFLLTSDNHNSVNGVREYARGKGAAVHYIPIMPPELYADEDYLEWALDHGNTGHNNLFAYPAQSNFTGVQHPLEWIPKAQEKGWDVLLDAAAFVPTNRLDLSLWHPDFVVISFYKIFGYPTGTGCLLMRKNKASKLHRPWFSGGTITFSSVAAFNHYLTPGPAGFEDGTANYLDIPAVDIGLKWIESIGMDIIHKRVTCLTDWLIRQLMSLYHSNGRPLVRLYGPPNMYRRGGVIQVNYFDTSGRMLDCYDMEKLANESGISLRAGCHCNPGAREAALGFTRDDLEVCFQDKEHKSLEQFLTAIQGKTTGALRASLGLSTNFADVYHYVQFAKTFIDYKL